MTQDEYKIDTELLEDGEYVLWAVGNLKPKKKWVYPKWLERMMTIFYYVILFGCLIVSWQVIKNGRDITQLLGQISAPMFMVLIIMTINMWAKSRGVNLEHQSAYYVGMITNRRLVLFNADRGADHTLYPGDISSVQADFHNGARALRLDLSDGKSHVTMVTSGNLAKAKQLIESGFLSRQATEVAQ